MKIFWEVMIGEKKFYTGKAVKYVLDKKTNIRYNLGEGKWYKKKDYPKNLLEDEWDYALHACRFNFYYGVSSLRHPDRIEKKGFFKRREIYSTKNPKDFEMEYLQVFGLWKIEGLNVYTARVADFIREKASGIEYKRGEMKLFYDEDETPFPLAEHTDQYEFIYELERGGVGATDYLRDVSVAIALKK